MSLSAAGRQQRARIAGLTRSSRYDGHEVVAKARAAFDERFRREVIELAAERGEELTEAEVARRAQAALKAHMARLAFRSAKARSGRREAAE